MIFDFFSLSEKSFFLLVSNFLGKNLIQRQAEEISQAKQKIIALNTENQSLKSKLEIVREGKTS